MKVWLVYALFAAGLWGLWGFFGKLAARSLSSGTLFLVAALGCIAAFMGCFLYYAKHFHVSLDNIDSWYGFLSGFVLIAGLFFFYLALTKGEVTRIVVITATYPLVTLILAYLVLKEPFSLQKIFGIILSVSGIILLSI